MGYIINLLAFCLPMTLFVFWGVIGYAALALLHTQRNLVRNLLLAPTVGLAVTLLPIYWLSYLGLPVIEFASVATFSLLVISVGLLCWLRPIIPLRHYWPFALVLFVALLVTGSSLLNFGFAWLSYTNDDMANYCLGALRFLHQGYYTFPDIKQLVQGRDYSLYYWFLYIPSLIRAGSELLLAWLSGVTGLMPDKVFMPLIVAMQLTLVSVMGALVYSTKKYKSAALTVCVLVSFSAMLGLGVFYQLIAQVAGLSLLIATTVLLLRTNFPVKKVAILSQALLTAIVAAAFVIIYPEIVPILGLAFIGYYLIFFMRGGKLSLPLVLYISSTTLIVLLLASTNIATFLGTLILQSQHGFSVKVVLFPYFLVPTGLAEFWGFHAIGADYFSELKLTVGIVLGAILLILALISTIWLSMELYSVAVVTLIMFGMAIVLFIHHVDFGLFKIAMYIQPFILSTLVIAWFRVVKQPFYRILPFFLLIIVSWHVLKVYIDRAQGIGIFDVPGASQTQINIEFDRLLNTIPKSQQIILDTSAVELAKYQMLYTRDRNAYFASAFFLGSLVDFGGLTFQSNHLIWQYLTTNKTSDGIKKFIFSIPQTSMQLHFNLHDVEHAGSGIDKFEKQLFDADKTAVLIASAPSQTIFNRSKLSQVKNQDFVALPWQSVSNYLIFVNSDRGLHYYLGAIRQDLADISLYSLEQDYFYPTKTYASVGRYLLFQVVHPSQKMRLVLDTTATLVSGGQSKLPSAAVIGAQREPLALVGRGSARVVSAPITPQFIASNPYIAIDMGSEGYYYQMQRKRVTNLYGANVKLDTRKINAYVRNITLISDAQYEHLKSPSNLSKFPADLANPNLEYSGIYEDGWVAEKSYMLLQQPVGTDILAIIGKVPNLSDPTFSTQLTVLVDNKIVARKKISVGDFSIKIKLSEQIRRHRIELQFTNIESLPAPDGRPIAAKIAFIGFE